MMDSYTGSGRSRTNNPSLSKICTVCSTAVMLLGVRVRSGGMGTMVWSHNQPLPPLVSHGHEDMY